MRGRQNGIGAGPGRGAQQGAGSLSVPHATEGAASAVDAILLAASIAAVLWRRAPLAWVACLVAADPLWAQAFAATVSRLVPPEPAAQALSTALADAPLWAAFIVGFRLLLSPAGGRERA